MLMTGQFVSLIFNFWQFYLVRVVKVGITTESLLTNLLEINGFVMNQMLSRLASLKPRDVRTYVSIVKIIPFLSPISVASNPGGSDSIIKEDYELNLTKKKISELGNLLVDSFKILLGADNKKLVINKKMFLHEGST